jgi:hypothetical protein
MGDEPDGFIEHFPGADGSGGELPPGAALVEEGGELNPYEEMGEQQQQQAEDAAYHRHHLLEAGPSRSDMATGTADNGSHGNLQEGSHHSVASRSHGPSLDRPPVGRRQVDANEVWPPYADPTYVMPGDIEVRAVDPTNGEFYFFNVRIEKCAARKLYLGGYRNKKTGLLYHHASSQTVTEHKMHLLQDSSHLMSRETQTVEVRTLSIQTYREFGTQMQRQDVHIDSSTDVEIAPRAYFSADELAELKAVKCIEIQRAWRGHMARRRAHRIQAKIAERSQLAFEDK